MGDGALWRLKKTITTNDGWSPSKGRSTVLITVFFAQSSSLQKAAKTVLEAFAEFKRQVKVFD